jgi:beta-carotene hydroxylase
MSLTPRYSADYRTILWMCVLAPATMAAQFVWPQLIGGWTTLLSLYLGVSAAVIVHNHVHSPVFADKRANTWFSHLLSVFYGHPVFVWMPTHNQNHHKLVNKAGDATITWRISNSHNAFIAVTYFFVSAFHQSKLSAQFVERAKVSNKKLHEMTQNQQRVWFAANVAIFATALLWHGVHLGLRVWFFAVAVPAFAALWTVHLFNYEQHVHTDPWSRYDHSRNFVSPVLNFLLFNNGYHTVHHESAGTHWSELPAEDAKIADWMHPSLRQKSVWWYWTKQYLLSPVFPSLGTRQIGRAPFDVAGLDLTTETVDAVMSNASRTPTV